jgi:hypothetical protein
MRRHTRNCRSRESGRNETVASCLRLVAARNWSLAEVEATVADYLEMLGAELRGEPYSKTEHRNKILQLLDNRTAGAIELKHQNISAILIELSVPYVPGYKPASNYQKLLRDVVVDRLARAEGLAKLMMERAMGEPSTPRLADVLAAFVPGPERDELERQAKARLAKGQVTRPPRMPDYFAIESQNRDLGRTGEEFVLNLERERPARWE